MDPAGGAQQLNKARPPASAFPRGWTAAALLLLLAAAALLPALAPLPGTSPGPWFKDDDFAAIHHASSIERTLADFTGPRQGLRFMLLYWRPLATLSLWTDHQLFGAHPAGFHLHVALVHGLCGWLLLMVLLRLGAGTAPAALAALLFTASPVTLQSSLWVSGRTDVHAWALVLLAVLLHLRTPAGRLPLLPLPAFAAALAFKETAVAFVLLAPGADLLAGRRRPLRHHLPALAVLAAWLALRHHALGTMAGGLPPVAGPGLLHGGILAGLFHALHNLAAPPGPGPWPWRWLGHAAILLGLALALRRGRPGGVALAGAALCLAAVLGPLLPVLGARADLGAMRHFYAVAAAHAGFLALAARSSPLPALLALLAALPASWEAAASLRQRGEDHRALHAGLLEAARRTPEGTPLLVDPRTRQAETLPQILSGLDRLHTPPFAPAFRQVLGLHALLALQPDPHPSPFAVLASLRATPAGLAEGPLPPPPRRPRELAAPVTAELLAALAGGEAGPSFSTALPPGEPSRVLFLTGFGLLSLTVPVDGDGRIRLRDLLLAPLRPDGNVTLLEVLPYNLDMQLAQAYYVATSRDAPELFEIEFDRCVLPFLVDALGWRRRAGR